MSKKVEQIVKEKVDMCKKALIRSYYNSSYIVKVVNTYDADIVFDQDNFLKIGHWKYIPYELFTDIATFPDPIFSQYGFSIAHGEIKYFVNQLLDNSDINVNKIEKCDIDFLSSKINDVYSSSYTYNRILNNNHIFLFAPIEFFMDINMNWLRQYPNKLRRKEGQFYIDGIPVNIYWSNKYNQFKDFIIFDKTFASWFYKPNVKDRLHIYLNRSIEEPFSMELKAEIVFMLKIDEPNLVTIIRPEILPTKDRS